MPDQEIVLRLAFAGWLAYRDNLMTTPLADMLATAKIRGQLYAGIEKEKVYHGSNPTSLTCDSALKAWINVCEEYLSRTALGR